MRQDNYVYFVTTNGTPRDNGSKTLEKRETLPKFKNLQKGIARETKKGNYYYFVLPNEEETKYNLSESLNNIKLSIYSLRAKFEITISKTSRINHIPWEEVKSIFDSISSNSTTKIIVCNGIMQYPTKEQRTHSIEGAHSSALGGHKGVTKTYGRIRQKIVWENMKVDIQKYIQGNLYIITIQDNFIKYSLAIPLPIHQASTIADAFVKKFICILGHRKEYLLTKAEIFKVIY